MCQCLICGCCWWNYCGVCCGGVHEAACIYSCWLCKPEDLRLIDPECCHICACDGWGGNCLWSGIICCAPSAVMEWSGLRAAGKTAADLNKQVIVINNTSPIYMTHEMGNPNMEMNYQGGANYQGGGNFQGGSNFQGANYQGGVQGGIGINGVGVNVNSGYGGNPGMNANMGGGVNMNLDMGVNAGPQGMNAKINF